MTLTVLKGTSQVFFYNVSRLKFSDVFLIFRLGLWVLGKTTTELNCPSHHSISGGILCPCDLSLLI
jgi:hypothetical protein